MFSIYILEQKLISFKNVKIVSPTALDSEINQMVLTLQITKRGRRGRFRMVVGVATTCAISTYHHSGFELQPQSWPGVLDTTLCDKVV